MLPSAVTPITWSRVQLEEEKPLQSQPLNSTAERKRAGSEWQAPRYCRLQTVLLPSFTLRQMIVYTLAVANWRVISYKKNVCVTFVSITETKIVYLKTWNAIIGRELPREKNTWTLIHPKSALTSNSYSSLTSFVLCIWTNIQILPKVTVTLTFGEKDNNTINISIYPWLKSKGICFAFIFAEHIHSHCGYSCPVTL